MAFLCRMMDVGRESWNWVILDRKISGCRVDSNKPLWAMDLAACSGKKALGQRCASEQTIDT